MSKIWSKSGYNKVNDYCWILLIWCEINIYSNQNKQVHGSDDDSNHSSSSKECFTSGDSSSSDDSSSSGDRSSSGDSSNLDGNSSSDDSSDNNSSSDDDSNSDEGGGHSTNKKTSNLGLKRKNQDERSIQTKKKINSEDKGKGSMNENNRKVSKTQRTIPSTNDKHDEPNWRSKRRKNKK